MQVRKLLATSSPVPLKLPGSQQAGDVELVSAQQQRLMAVAVRTMALPLGRGAVALGEFTSFRSCHFEHHQGADECIATVHDRSASGSCSAHDGSATTPMQAPQVLWSPACLRSALWCSAGCRACMTFSAAVGWLCDVPVGLPA